MPKAKTRKIVLKRFKLTKNGKLLKKANNTSHRKRIDDSSARSRKAKETRVSKGFEKKIKLMIIK